MADVKDVGDLKAIIEDFIRITNIDYEDQTEKIRQKSSVIEWQFRAGRKIVISKNVNRDDRIHLSVTMAFPREDAKVLVIKNPSFSKTVMQISEICTLCGVGHQWIKGGDGHDGKNGGENAGSPVIGLSITTHIDVEVLSRHAFHDVWANLTRVSSHIQKIIHSNFNELPSSVQHNDSIPDGIPEGMMYG